MSSIHYIFVYVCIDVCMHAVCMYVGLCMCVSARVCTCMCMYLHMYVCTYVHIKGYLFIYLFDPVLGWKDVVPGSSALSESNINTISEIFTTCKMVKPLLCNKYQIISTLSDLRVLYFRTRVTKFILFNDALNTF